MVRIRTVWYWKRYMRKSRYRYKRYLLYLPKAIGDLVDTKVEYVVQLFGPAIVLLRAPALRVRVQLEGGGSLPPGTNSRALDQGTVPLQ